MTREATIAALFDKERYSIEHTWQPAFALQRKDFDFEAVCGIMMGFGGARHALSISSLTSHPRTDDFARFASRLQIQAEDIKPFFTPILSLMGNALPTSGIWQLTKALVDAVPDPTPLISTVLLNGDNRPLELLRSGGSRKSSALWTLYFPASILNLLHPSPSRP